MAELVAELAAGAVVEVVFGVATVTAAEVAVAVAEN